MPTFPTLVETWELLVYTCLEPSWRIRPCSPSRSGAPQIPSPVFCLLIPGGQEADPVFLFPLQRPENWPLAGEDRVTAPSGLASERGKLSPCGPRATGPPLPSSLSQGTVILRGLSGPAVSASQECARTRKMQLPAPSPDWLSRVVGEGLDHKPTRQGQVLAAP